ncbi:hypothetical protein [Kushneria pakistanensis]|uniref:hypothetical protein n=1 Tax=Kushneria pakistanensis TaxID=1508770 RepID=UPI001677E36A|nr:hypothetical protein [Kushneria pakistanensis]
MNTTQSLSAWTRGAFSAVCILVSQTQQAGLVLGYAGSHEKEIARAGGWLARAWQSL